MPEFGEGVPNRGTAETSLDRWNQQLRQSSIYQNFMRQNGLPTDGRVRLTRQQQTALEAALRANGIQIPGGMHIDQGGNLNQKNTLVRNSLIGAGVAGAGLGALGLAGIGPFAGGAASSAMPAGYVPGWEGNANLLGFGAYGGGAGSAATGAGLGAGAAGAGAAGAGVGAGAGLGAGAAGSGLFAGLSARDLVGLGLAGAGAVGGALPRPQNFNANTATSDPNLQRLLATMQGRLDKSEPLYDSIMAMANGLLPTQYQKGGGGMR